MQLSLCIIATVNNIKTPLERFSSDGSGLEEIRGILLGSNIPIHYYKRT